LGEVLEKNKEKNKDRKYTLVQSVSNKFGFINQDEYFENRIVASKDTSNYYVIRKGCFAYNPSRIDVGSLAYKNDENISIISPLYVSFKAKNDKVLDLYLLNWFRSNGFIEQMIFEGGVRNTLNFDNLIEISIPLPSLPEQEKIAACLSSLDEIITAQTQKIEQLQRHKKGLLQGLFPNINNE
jgi:type I restriction enzyme S subunit